MAATSAAKASSKLWVWRPTEDSAKAPGAGGGFRHPAELPSGGAAAEACFLQGVRGVRAARLSQVDCVGRRGNMLKVVEKGAGGADEVPKEMVLHWYEGCLLLQEIEATEGKPDHTAASWFDADLRAALNDDRRTRRVGLLSEALYTEQKLLNEAVTGPFIENGEKLVRRLGLKGGDPPILDESVSETGDGHFGVADLSGYLPPWKAFCHPKCGLYQDFYLVRWVHPFSQIDYASVENGCKEQPGATWEPDECLPQALDPLRFLAKKNWIKAQREREQRAAQETAQKQQQVTTPVATPPSAEQNKRGSEAAEQSPAVLKRYKRDGNPLDRDIFQGVVGHDMKPETEEQFSGVRTGWPKHAKDYPVGYGVASPPGFCLPSCDCMDDQRLQSIEELTKKWLDEMDKTSGRSSNITNTWKQFEAQNFIWRRGLTTNQPCIMSTNQHPDSRVTQKMGDTPSAKAARELARIVVSSITDTLNDIPVREISKTESMRIPLEAFITDLADYDPTSFGFSDPKPPEWLGIDENSGELFLPQGLGERELAEATQGVKTTVEAHHMEGLAGSASIQVTNSQSNRWVKATLPVARALAESTLDPGVQEVIKTVVSEVCDFENRSAREVSLGKWLEVMSRTLRMAKAAGTSHVRPMGR